MLKELTAKESQTAEATSFFESQEEINGVKLLKRNFQEATDINRMVQTATEIIKRNESVITLFYSADAKSAKIMIMAGTEAIAKGINAGNAVKEAAPIFGGGGGGRPNFAQGGGTKPEKLLEAVKKAEDAMKKQLKH